MKCRYGRSDVPKAIPTLITALKYVFSFIIILINFNDYFNMNYETGVVIIYVNKMLYIVPRIFTKYVCEIAKLQGFWEMIPVTLDYQGLPLQSTLQALLLRDLEKTIEKLTDERSRPRNNFLSFSLSVTAFGEKRYYNKVACELK